MVVDLAVRDHPASAGGVGERLPATVEVDDREPGVPEPGPADQPGAVTVGTAVVQPRQHVLAERDVGREAFG